MIQSDKCYSCSNCKECREAKKSDCKTFQEHLRLLPNHTNNLQENFEMANDANKKLLAKLDKGEAKDKCKLRGPDPERIHQATQILLRRIVRKNLKRNKSVHTQHSGMEVQQNLLGCKQKTGKYSINGMLLAVK